MAAPIDRGRLHELLRQEQDRFVALHPRFGRTRHGGGDPSRRRRADALDDAVARCVPDPRGGGLGSRFVDVDGIEYVDFCLGDTGAMAGHRCLRRRGDRRARRSSGITTMLPSEDAAWVGGELARRFGLAKWQMAMTATDANRFVLRLARHLTGRPKVAVMDWCYHGTVDETLARPRRRPGRLPARAAIGPQVDPALTTRVVQFNDLDALERALAHGDVAAVLMEPALTNIGIVLPEPGYLDGVRELTRRHGTLLVIDETHTICVGPGGCTAAWGLEPDVFVVGKPIGGGVPVAAYGDDRRHRRPARRGRCGARHRRGGRRRHAHRERAGARRDPRHAVDHAARAPTTPA